MTRGFRNNNPGNIRISQSDWQGKSTDNTDGSFEQFNDFTYGLRALILLILNYISVKGKRTVYDIISTYAPPIENATEKYAAYVANEMKISKHTIFDLSFLNLFNLVNGIVKYENGGKGIDLEQFRKAFELLPGSKKNLLRVVA